MTRTPLTAIAGLLAAVLLPVQASADPLDDPIRGTVAFTGIDGNLHDPAPIVVDGLDGELFYGGDFDVACAIGKDYTRSLNAMSKLAAVIDRSGRRAVWTAAPSKSSVLPDRLDTSNLPHGSCDRAGLRQEIRAIDAYTDPTFIPLRRKLAEDPRQVFWKTDLHWTTVGGAVFAKQLARRLDPELGRRQRYRLGTETAIGMLNAVRDDATPETWQSAYPRGPVSVRTTADSRGEYETFPDVVFDHSWKSSPARKTWPGRTLLLGDSMMLFALQNLRPIFREGRFLWVDHTGVDEVVRSIVRSDTVVMEVLQPFLPLDQFLPSASFRRAVARALRADARR